MQKSNELILPNYFSVLIADVRYCKDLSASEKILYSEITALTNLRGYCTAKNQYFSILYGVTKRTIQLWLENLSRLNFIRIKNESGIRKIFIVVKPKNLVRKKLTKNEKQMLNDFYNSMIVDLN